MTRVPYLNDLVSFLKTTPFLDKIGVDANDCINGRNIIVKSQYRGIDEDSQFGCAIWINPLDAFPIKKNPVGSDCPTIMKHRVMLLVAVHNAYNCENHFEPNVVDAAEGKIEMVGAYIQAADIEECLKKAMRDFNSKLTMNGICKDYEAFQLCELPEPDEHEGHLIMPSIWETQYAF